LDAAVLAGEGHAPVEEVLPSEQTKKAVESIAAPKGRESRIPDLFPANRLFLGYTKGP
jgi:hypothetical protein